MSMSLALYFFVGLIAIGGLVIAPAIVIPIVVTHAVEKNRNQ